MTSPWMSKVVKFRSRDKIDFSKSMFSLPHQPYTTTRPRCPHKTYLWLSTPPRKSSFFRDGLPYNGFLKAFSIADMANFEWNKLIGLIPFAIMPNFAPFQDEPPFFSHRTIVKQIVATLRAAK